MHDQAEAIEAAQRIGTALRTPFVLHGGEVFASASIGLAFSKPGETEPEALLRNADMALYRAKTTGKARHALFEPSMQQGALDRLDLETALRQALARGEFEVEYQPIIRLTDGLICEVEALLRWRHPHRGLISPAQFIPLAEETGLIVPIGQWVLEMACQQARHWQIEHPNDPALGVSVNLSARQLQHPELLSDIERALGEADLDPRTLKLEITESVLMDDVDAAAMTLQALTQLGVRVAVDDFGTGYSSLAYLKRFPVDTLKIDRSFVDGLGHDLHDEAIVQSVIALAKTLRLTVTAEGVETTKQQAYLQALGCDRGQGYLFSRPLRPDALCANLCRQRSDQQERLAA